MAMQGNKSHTNKCASLNPLAFIGDQQSHNQSHIQFYEYNLNYPNLTCYRPREGCDDENHIITETHSVF